MEPVNDNENWCKASDDLNDEQKLNLILSLLESGVEINTAFIKENEDTSVFTHEMIRITSGDCHTLSQPVLLSFPLVAASGRDLNVTVN